MMMRKTKEQLNEEMLRVYTPMVNDICDRKNVTQYELEHFLDYLLSACFSDGMTALFKKVCRRFYSEYPEIIEDYVLFYREMYEETNEKSFVKRCSKEDIE